MEKIIFCAEIFIDRDIIKNFREIIRSFHYYFNSDRYFKNLESLVNNISIQLSHNGVFDFEKNTLYPQVFEYLLNQIKLDKPEKIIHTLDKLIKNNKKELTIEQKEAHKLMYQALLKNFRDLKFSANSLKAELKIQPQHIS